MVVSQYQIDFSKIRNPFEFFEQVINSWLHVLVLDGDFIQVRVLYNYASSTIPLIDKKIGYSKRCLLENINHWSKKYFIQEF